MDKLNLIVPISSLFISSTAGQAIYLSKWEDMLHCKKLDYLYQVLGPHVRLKLNCISQLQCRYMDTAKLEIHKINMHEMEQSVQCHFVTFSRINYSI